MRWTFSSVTLRPQFKANLANQIGTMALVAEP